MRLLVLLLACPAIAAGQALSIDASILQGDIPRIRTGQNLPWTNDGEGIWDPGANRIYPEVCRWTKELAPRFLRYPAGVSGNDFTWSETIGASRVEQPTDRCGALQAPDFGLDEFLSLVEHLRAANGFAEPLLLLNVVSAHSCAGRHVDAGSPESAVALAAFVNADPADARPIGKDESGVDWGTVGSWAQRRADNGHPAPYGVTWFELGNELYGSEDARTYAQRASAVALKLKAFFPEAKAIAVGNGSPWSSWTGDLFGTQQLAEARSGGTFAVDGVAIHPYGQYDYVDAIRLAWPGVQGRSVVRELAFPNAGSHTFQLTTRTPLDAAGTISVELFGADSENRAPDPGMEAASTAWASSNAAALSLSLERSQVHRGAQSLRLTATSPGAPASLAIPTAAGDSSVGVWLRSLDFRGTVKVGYTSCSPGEGDDHFVEVVPSSSEWRRYAVRALAGGTCLKALLVARGVGTFFADDVKVTSAAAQAQVAAGAASWTAKAAALDVPSAGARDVALIGTAGQLVFARSTVAISGASTFSQEFGRSEDDAVRALTAGDVALNVTRFFDIDRQKMEAASPRAAGLPYFITEWNRDALNGNTAIDALAAIWGAEYLRVLLSRGDVAGDDFFYLSGVGYGAFNAQTASPKGSVPRVRPMYEVLKLLSGHLGSSRIAATPSAIPTFDVDELVNGDLGALAAKPAIEFLATADPGQRVAILAVNLESGAPLPVQIDLGGFAPAANGTAYTLAPSDLSATNESSTQVALQTSAFAASSSFSYAFPPRAVTLLEIPAEGADAGSGPEPDAGDPTDCGQGAGSTSARPTRCGCGEVPGAFAAAAIAALWAMRRRLRAPAGL